MSTVNSEELFNKTDFSDCKVVIAAVSGGGDSLALLFLLRDYLIKLENAPKLLVVTVDHQLRPESAAEAEKVSALCDKLGIDHKTVCWADSKPQTALSHEARIARYGLLISQAERIGATVIMTGHTLNDQAETYEMRLSRGSRRGLACMPRESLLMRKIRLIRPLLKVKREELRGYLRSIRQQWIDDPTNENMHYERVRIRKRLKDEDIDVIEQKVERAALQRRAQSKSAAQLVQQLNITMQHALCTVKEPSKDLVNHPDYAFIIGAFAAIIGGAQTLATDKQVDYLKEQLLKPHAALYRFTLLGAVIEKSGKNIRLWREARNQTCSVIAPHLSNIWDGRYRIDNHSENAVRVGVPSISDIKSLAKSAGLDQKKIHFLSLQTALAIFSRSGVDIPALTGKLIYAENTACRRFMRPFGWLVSSDDYPLFDALSPFFEAFLSTDKSNNEKT